MILQVKHPEGKTEYIEISRLEVKAEEVRYERFYSSVVFPRRDGMDLYLFDAGEILAQWSGLG
jgi:hypothetical protein